MVETMRVRVAPFRPDRGVGERGFNVAGPYLADVRLDVEGRLFFDSLQELLWAIDPDGEHYPHDRGGVRSSEPYVRRADVAAEHATPGDYDPLTEVWAIRESDGALLSWGFIDRRELLVADILRASEAGYNSHDFTDVIIGAQAGRGGDAPITDWVNFLSGLGLGLATNVVWVAASKAFAKVGIVVRSKKEDAEISRIAKTWETRGLTSPFRLRRWFDKKDEWSAVEVTTRLQIGVEATLRLLTALGYEPLKDEPDTFVRSDSKRAQKHRKRWEKKETESGLFEAW